MWTWVQLWWWGWFHSHEVIKWSEQWPHKEDGEPLFKGMHFFCLCVFVCFCTVQRKKKKAILQRKRRNRGTADHITTTTSTVLSALVIVPVVTSTNTSKCPFFRTVSLFLLLTCLFPLLQSHTHTKVHMTVSRSSGSSSKRCCCCSTFPLYVSWSAAAAVVVVSYNKKDREDWGSRAV